MIIASANANDVNSALWAPGWKVTTWFASMLVEDYQIRNTVRSAGVRKLFHDVVSSIYPMGVREHQTHFLQ